MADEAARAAGAGAVPRLWGLQRRRVVPELMDDLALPAASHAQALVSLVRINLLSATAASFHRPLRRLLKARPGEPLAVLDLASGAGDVPVRLARWARRHRLPLRFAGCDRSPRAVAWAAVRAENHGVEVQFFPHDVVADGVPQGWDVIICSLFLHHLSTPQVRQLLTAVGAVAGRGAILSDLIRSPLGFAAAWVGTRLLSSSPVVRADGPASVRAAFTLSEIRHLAWECLPGASVAWQWPFRYLLTWQRP